MERSNSQPVQRDRREGVVMIRRLLLLASPVFLIQHPAAAQVEMSGNVQYEPPTSFYVEALSYASPDSGLARLDVFIQAGYENLTFVKAGESYEASYEVTATLLDSSQATVSEQDWNEDVKGLPFNETIAAGASKVSQRSFTVHGGTFTLAVQSRDNENRAVRRLQQTVNVPVFGKPGLSLSSIMLVSRLTHQGGKTRIVPSISPNVGVIPPPLYLFLEAYNRGPADSVTFTTSVFDKKENLLIQSDTSGLCRMGNNEMFCRIDHTRLTVGDYRLTVAATRAGKSLPLAVVARLFVVRWHGLPMGTNNLDLAIDQVRYIARDSEMDSLKSAKTPEEKQKLFLEFWKRRDPNPNTPRNERMEEYYTRVEYANRHFSRYREGWRTDMGLVYILLGPPSNVERHPFESDTKPYEVWSYYDLNQAFVFVDENGFGDYRLVTPLSEVYRRQRQ